MNKVRYIYIDRYEDFLAPDFYLNCFFFVSFFILFNKRILLLILLTQTRQFCVLFFVVEVLYLSKILYIEGESLPVSCVEF